MAIDNGGKTVGAGLGRIHGLFLELPKLEVYLICRGGYWIYKSAVRGEVWARDLKFGSCQSMFLFSSFLDGHDDDDDDG